ncbi:helix-turn-helix transcriptional regulator [Clostridium sp. 'deep sea']|uniref:helix-turn-helix domain-containing protein n=1 Tax=Clostridium sp. 'deep sea' TaxID=2779445 RepID=UPI001896915E|nr:helix-turn-helix domain-containing protein [Clostridium sp. 'deep sea']QOR35199.1 helix-turn-helix transcriptional regulator [Clostridium sp. 'deep sea']
MIQELEYDYRGALCMHAKSDLKNSLGLLSNIEEDNNWYTELPNLLGLSIFNFIPQESITLKEKMSTSNHYMMSFCIGERFEWSLADSLSKHLTIEHNETCIMTCGTERCISTYDEGLKYHGIGVFFNPSRIQIVADCLKCENAINSFKSLSNGLNRYTITPHIHAILSQIVNCNIYGRLRYLYLEAKLLELIAVYLDEIVCQRNDKLPDLSLSKDDLFALKHAKDVLDKTFVHPLTLAKLSKMVYLNEYKLKTGFKLRYGQTVYGYVREKRMELARILIEQRRFKVSDIAGMVGYANTSHFISAFSKKYGVTPGKFAREETSGRLSSTHIKI